MYLLGVYISPVAMISTFFILLLSCMIKLKSKKYNLPPGPWPLPIVGNIPLFMWEPDFIKVFKKLKLKYGPVFSLKFGIHDTIVVSNIELAIEALVKKQVDFAGRPNIPSFDQFSEGRKNISLGDYDSEWHMRRKLGYKAVKSFLSGPSLDEKVSSSVEKVLKDMSKIEKPFDPHHHVDLMLFNVMSDICYGTRYELDDTEFLKIVEANENFLETFGNGLPSDYIPWMRFFEGSAVRKLKDFLDLMITDTQAILDRHKENFDPNNLKDLTDYLLLAKHKANEEGNTELLNQLTDIHLRQILLDMIFAGTFTSSMTITWVILMVVLHPEVQVKMQEEIDSVLGKEKMVAAMKEHFPYCTAVLREAMRISPIVPIGLPRATTCDTTLGGYDIPSGRQVLFNIWELHHDPEKWKNPDEFHPENFLTESGELAPKPESFLPFMAGRRVCLGESIAKPEMLIMIVFLFQRFHFSSPPGVTPPMTGILASSGYMAPKFNILIKER